jgi:hypothetical protein
MTESTFKLRRRPSSYNVDDMERWLREHPAAAISFAFSKQGWSTDPTDKRQWKMYIVDPLRDPKKLTGYVTESIADALACLCNEEKQ